MLCFSTFFLLLRASSAFGVPTRKRCQKGSKNCSTVPRIWAHFGAKVSIGTPPKKRPISDSSLNGPKAAFGRPRCPKGAQQGAFWRYFWHLFRVQWEKCVLMPLSRDIQFLRVSGYPKIINFSYFFRGCVKCLPRGHFGEDF